MRTAWLNDLYKETPAVAMACYGFELLHWATPAAADITTCGAKPRKEYVRLMCRLPVRLNVETSQKIDPSVILGALLHGNACGRLGSMKVRRALTLITDNEYDSSWAKLDAIGMPFPRWHAPFDYIENAYRLLVRRSKIATVEQEDVLLLMLMGLGSHGLMDMTRCELCPRWAIPAQPFCNAHTQSLRHSRATSASERASLYRHGKQVAAYYQRHFASEPNFFAIDDHAVLSILRRLLWTTELPDEARTLRAVRYQIDQNVALQQMIGEPAQKLRPIALYARLRQCIDPYEVRPAAWLAMLKRMRVWLMYSDSVQQMPRKTPTRQWRVMCEASSLERSGFSKTQIARILGISKSTISNWLSRTGAKTISEAIDMRISEHSAYAHPKLRTYEQRLRSMRGEVGLVAPLD